jgi:putative Holliday junction resolvase
MHSEYQKVPATRIVGIDYGLARIGVALSDESKMISSPMATIASEKRAEQTVIKLLNELTNHQKVHRYTLEEIVIGLPLMMNGKSGLLADEVRHFVELLRAATSIPIVTWDERLTTVQAERALRESSMTRKKRSKMVDTVSAAILLQSYLDHRFLKS